MNAKQIISVTFSVKMIDPASMTKMLTIQPSLNYLWWHGTIVLKEKHTASPSANSGTYGIPLNGNAYGIENIITFCVQEFQRHNMICCGSRRVINLQQNGSDWRLQKRFLFLHSFFLFRVSRGQMFISNRRSFISHSCHIARDPWLL